MSKLVLLLGGQGYVGQAFQQLLSKQGYSCRVLSRGETNYAEGLVLSRVLAELNPAFVINAAGYTGKPNVDACELNKAACLDGNAVLPGTIGKACAEAGIPWGHVSSGCIYNGRRVDGRGFSETDAPNFCFRTNNCSFYSGTKALGEEVLQSYPNSYVWRLRIPFNEVDSPRNYLTKLMRYDTLLEAENSISQLEEFVAACFATWTRSLPFGIYNITNPGFVTTREVVDLILKSGVCRKDYKFFTSEADFMAKAAKTPRSNCVLDTTKLESSGIRLREVHEAVELALRQWKAQAS